MKKIFLNKNIISLTLILSVILMPLASLPQKAEAQSISGYLGGVAPAISQLPLCKQAINKEISGLFNSGTSSVPLSDPSLMGPPEPNLDDFAPLLDEISGEGTISEMSVRTYDPLANKKLDTIKIRTEQTAKNIDSLETNDTCLKSIGRLVIKMLLQKMTLATVDWINNGFDGGPAFLQDPEGFFKDIRKNEILQFGVEINNPELFPFGQAFMQNQARAFQNKFADNAQYSLNKLIQDNNSEFSAQTFYEDFSQGGWDAWTYLTQVPANNPLGFNIMASNELQKRLEGTEMSTAQQFHTSLEQSGGYLGDYRCSYPKNVTKEQEKEALNNGKPSPCTGGWEYVTPGAMVADAATNIMGYTTNNLLKVEDLNDAIAAILDALLNRFSADIIGDGFSEFSKNIPYGANSGNFILNENNLTNYGVQQVYHDFPEFTIQASNWLQQNPYFDIRTDLNQALIDEQRIYIEKLEKQNEELYSTITPTETNPKGNYGLIPTIYQLDYCIPGPHPGWENDSREVLNAVQGAIPVKTEEDLDKIDIKDITGVAKVVAPLAGAYAGATIGASIGSVVPVLGNIAGAIAGATIGATAVAVINLVEKLFTSNSQKLKIYYSFVFSSLTGIPLGGDKNSLLPSNKWSVIEATNAIFERYVKIIHQVYDNPYMPNVTSEAALEFNRLAGYGKMIDDNQDKIDSLNSVVITLNEMKSKIDALNQKRGSMTQAQYEDQLTIIINEFGRLSAKMVSGDNIANTDNILKQIIDKKNYIYKVLLKGPGGCEQDLSTGQATQLPWQIFDTKRMTYPAPIFYDYNDLEAGETIPDPFNSGYKNYMRSGIAVNNVGPGFLSWINFEDGKTWNACNGSTDDFTSSGWTCRLKVHDLFDLGQRGASVGRRANKTGTAGNDGQNDWNWQGIWESMIGVY